MRALILVTGLFTFACSHFGESTSEQGSEPAINAASSAVHAPVPLNAAEFELRLAKLWARVDELENHQIRQRERMKLLEKGLLLGLIPEDLKADKSDHKRTAQNQEAEGEKNSDLPKDVPSTVVKAPSTEPIAGEKSRDIAEYRRKLQIAQDKFNAANYGQAIVNFNEIGEHFDESITEGNQYYWIGLAWFYLKEYQLSEVSFHKIIDSYSKNSWVPYCRFYLAKIDLNRGLTGRARDQFKLLIDEFPTQDLSEMSRMEIDKMREKL